MDTATAHATPPPRPPRRAGGVWVRVTLSLTILAALLAWVDVTQVWATLRSASAPWLLVLAVMFAGERCLGAYRWHLLLRAQGGTMSFGTTFRAVLVGAFVGGFLPGTLGTEAVRMLTMSRATGRAGMSVSSVLFDRLLGSLALLAIVILALALVPRGEVAPAVTFVAVAALLGTAGLTLGLLHAGTRRRLNRLADRLPWRTAQQELHAFADAGASLRHRPGVLARVMGWSLVFQGIRVGISPVAAQAIGLDVPLAYFLLYVPIIIFLMMIPISFSGLGVREAGFVYFFAAGLMTHEAALALSLLIACFTLLAQLPGGVFCITGVRRPTSALRGAETGRLA
ncbi:MAG: lysylphosphatidylglycerol synthase transmembrane domain-containing protein [Phycisphaeraceae bacterium]